MLAKPLDLPLALVEEQSVLSSSFTALQRPPGPGRQTATRPATSSQTTAPPTSPPETTAPTTTTPPSPPKSDPPPPKTTPPESPPAPPGQQPLDRVVELVNKERAKAGCNPLQVNAAVTTAAQNHSADMSARDYFAHTTPEGVPFDQRIKNAGYGLPGAENIAMGQKTADAVMNDWMKSPGHRANILNCQLKVIGVGLATDGFYWTQDFGF